MHQNVQHDVAVLLDKKRTALRDGLRAAFKEFQTLFEDTCSYKFGSSPEEHGLQIWLIRALKEVQEYLDGPMQRAFDSVSKDFC
jgi:hypothetical protein